MTHGSLFSGIGGFDLAAKWMGWDNVFHVERDPFCRQVLTHHFPQSQSFDDVKTFDATPFCGRVSIISGGFPCQPFSAAGKRAGTSDNRYLWPEMFRIIREARPTYVVAENVRGLLSWNEGLVLDTVCADLEGENYEVCPVVLPAAGVNAPHRRDRIWIVAHSISARAGNTSGKACDQGRTTGEDRGESIRQTHRAALSGGTSTAGANGIVAYANDKGGACGPRQVQGADGEVSQRNHNAQPCHAGATDATNAGGMGRERRRSEEAQRREGERAGLQPDVKGQSSGADATNATGQRSQRRCSTQRPEKTKGHIGPRNAQPKRLARLPNCRPYLWRR